MDNIIKARGIQTPHTYTQVGNEKYYDFVIFEGNKKTTIILPIEGAKVLQKALNATFQ